MVERHRGVGSKVLIAIFSIEQHGIRSVGHRPAPGWPGLDWGTRHRNICGGYGFGKRLGRFKRALTAKLILRRNMLEKS
jgi:hypothetical protein